MVQSVDLPDDILAAVRMEASLQNRSVAEQVLHWLKIGRAIEKAKDFNYQRICDALDGTLSPDELTSEEQDCWQAQFMAKMTEPNEQEEVFHASRRNPRADPGETSIGPINRLGVSKSDR